MIDVSGHVLMEFVFQMGGETNPDVSLGEGILGGAGSTFLLTLILGAILVAIAPEYTERMMSVVAEDPIDSFLYGVMMLLLLAIFLVALVFTFIGIPIAAVLVVVAYVVWTGAAAIAFLAIADRLVDRDDGWLVPLVVAATMNGGLVLTGIGWFVAIAIGLVGFGAVMRDALD